MVVPRGKIATSVMLRKEATTGLAIRPVRIDVPQETLVDLRQRKAETR
jgi:hypothetical protein